MTVRIAVVQQDHNPGRVDENRAKALEFAREALAHGADIVLFHEELLVGYVEDPRKLAEEVEGSTTRAFQSLLKGSEALILYGLTERQGDRFYIAAPAVSAAGVMAHYRKTHLWWNGEGPRHEPSFYTPGSKLVTFPLKGFKSGIMICYDGDFPEMTRAYANRGCSMLFWLNNRGSRGHKEVADLARRNSMIIAASCCCGTNERGHECPGGSNITDYDGTLITEIWGEEGIIYADVMPEAVPEARKANPWFMGQRQDLYR
jgi:predicted amidohydrolase